MSTVWWLVSARFFGTIWAYRERMKDAYRCCRNVSFEKGLPKLHDAEQQETSQSLEMGLTSATGRNEQGATLEKGQ